MDGRVCARIPSDHKHQPLLPRKKAAEHEAAQTAKERIAISDPRWMVDWFVLVLYKNIGWHRLNENGALLWIAGSRPVEFGMGCLHDTVFFWLITFSTLLINSCGLNGLEI